MSEGPQRHSNVPLANSIFAPTIMTAAFFITFLFFRPMGMRGEELYLWAGGGSLLAAVIGFVIGFRFRHSERLNLIIRWLMMVLMVLLIGFAAYMSLIDLKIFVEGEVN